MDQLCPGAWRHVLAGHYTAWHRDMRGWEARATMELFGEARAKGARNEAFKHDAQEVRRKGGWREGEAGSRM